jgi:hypothetical protein
MAQESPDERIERLQAQLRREQERYTLMEKQNAALKDALRRSYQFQLTGRKRTDELSKER